MRELPFSTFSYHCPGLHHSAKEKKERFFDPRLSLARCISASCGKVRFCTDFLKGIEKAGQFPPELLNIPPSCLYNYRKLPPSQLDSTIVYTYLLTHNHIPRTPPSTHPYNRHLDCTKLTTRHRAYFILTSLAADTESQAVRYHDVFTSADARHGDPIQGHQKALLGRTTRRNHAAAKAKAAQTSGQGQSQGQGYPQAGKYSI